MVKNPPASAEMGIQSLGGEDDLEKEMATHSSRSGNPQGKTHWFNRMESRLLTQIGCS